MPTMIFVNLPVKDLARSREFYGKLGYSFNDQFSDEKATCVVISDTIFLMLLIEPFFTTFTKKSIADASSVAEAILAISTDSREDVDELADKAFAAGALQSNDPEDQGFMYSRSFQDPDGHLWEVFWMDPSTVEPSANERQASSV